MDEETMTQNISWLCQCQIACSAGPGIKTNLFKLGLFILMTLLFPLLKSSSNLIYTAIFSKILYYGLPLQSEIVEVSAISIWFNKFFFLSKLVSLSLSLSL